MKLFAIAAASLFISSAAHAKSYALDDFARVAKFDAHVHANTAGPEFLAIARKDGFQLLSINVDYPDFPALEDQARIARNQRATEPRRFYYATAFSMKGFGTPQWTTNTISTIDQAVKQGAVAVKVWKNVGMVEKDATGQRIFLDDPRFDGVIDYLERARIPLIAHQGEPRNCWLPLDQMSTENDRSYFKDHPEYYMFLHPDEPSYETLMAARDRFVGHHPKLIFIGAHLASLEWSVGKLSRFLDRFPNATVDMAARMTQLQAQSRDDHTKVRAFFLKYQDRLLYGTDLTDSPPDANARAQNPPARDDFAAEADKAWRSDWRYLATPLSQHVDAIKADVHGLALPRAVINKIYFRNARRIFRLGKNAPS
jgi:predicted TIM-barrel fold metal-dependent hydrolase